MKFKVLAAVFGMFVAAIVNMTIGFDLSPAKAILIFLAGFTIFSTISVFMWDRKDASSQGVADVETKIISSVNPWRRFFLFWLPLGLVLLGWLFIAIRIYKDSNPSVASGNIVFCAVVLLVIVAFVPATARRAGVTLGKKTASATQILSILGITALSFALTTVILFACIFLWKEKVAVDSEPPYDSFAEVEKCGLRLDVPLAHKSVHFPLEITGVIDSSNDQVSGCHWSMFEGQAGTAQLYRRELLETGDVSWHLITQSPILTSDRTSSIASFKTRLDFDNSEARVPAGSTLKIVLTEEDPSGRGLNSDSLDFLVTTF